MIDREVARAGLLFLVLIPLASESVAPGGSKNQTVDTAEDFYQIDLPEKYRKPEMYGKTETGGMMMGRPVPDRSVLKRFFRLGAGKLLPGGQWYVSRLLLRDCSAKGYGASGWGPRPRRYAGSCPRELVAIETSTGKASLLSSKKVTEDDFWDCQGFSTLVPQITIEGT